MLFGHRGAQLRQVLVAVDPQQGEWHTSKALHERPLVWVHFPARPSPIPPEVEDDHFTAVITQPHLATFDISPHDFGRD